MAEFNGFNKEPFVLAAFRHEYYGTTAPPERMLSSPAAVYPIPTKPEVGKIQLTLFMRVQDEQMFARFYHVPSGSVAWYKLTLA